MTDKQYKTKSDMVYHKMRESIFKGEYTPGERIFVSVVAEQYGISEIPVREAFRTLVQEGVLTSKPNNGFFISQISLKEVKNIFRVRVLLESMATKEACNNITEEGIASLESLYQEGRAFINSGDFSGYWKHNRKWHFMIYSFSGNDVLVRLISELFDFSARYPLYFTKKEEIEDSMVVHRQIIEALKERDADEAEALIRIHTLDTRNHYVARLQEVFGERLGD